MAPAPGASCARGGAATRRRHRRDSADDVPGRRGLVGGVIARWPGPVDSGSRGGRPGGTCAREHALEKSLCGRAGARLAHLGGRPARGTAEPRYRAVVRLARRPRREHVVHIPREPQRRHLGGWPRRLVGLQGWSLPGDDACPSCALVGSNPRRRRRRGSLAGDCVWHRVGEAGRSGAMARELELQGPLQSLRRIRWACRLAGTVGRADVCQKRRRRSVDRHGPRYHACVATSLEAPTTARTCPDRPRDRGRSGGRVCLDAID